MSAKDFSTAWEEAARRALETGQECELSPAQLSAAAGLRVRSGLAAGDLIWGLITGGTCGGGGDSHDGCSDYCR